MALRQPQERQEQPPQRVLEEPPADQELQKLINEARHSFDQEPARDIFATLAASDDDQEDDASPSPSMRARLAQEE